MDNKQTADYIILIVYNQPAPASLTSPLAPESFCTSSNQRANTMSINVRSNVCGARQIFLPSECLQSEDLQSTSGRHAGLA